MAFWDITATIALAINDILAFVSALGAILLLFLQSLGEVKDSPRDAFSRRLLEISLISFLLSLLGQVALWVTGQTNLPVGKMVGLQAGWINTLLLLAFLMILASLMLGVARLFVDETIYPDPQS